MSIEKILSELYKELPSGVTLVAVSKFHPAEMVREAYEAGQRDFAESRPQEMSSKVASLADLEGIRWHFIGHLQTNKLKLVLPYASLVQSVDSIRLLDAIQSWAASSSRKVSVLLELHVALEESKQGFSEEELDAVMHRAAAGEWPDVIFKGVMAMATFTEDESVIRSDFARARDCYMRLKEDSNLSNANISFDTLSMGMSGDWKLAVECGSNMVRIGTTIFGPCH